MKRFGAFLPLALLSLIAACGVGGSSGLRPTAPAPSPLSAQPQPAAPLAKVEQPTVAPWYKHYDLGEVVVRIAPGALASVQVNAATSSSSIAAPKTAQATLGAYTRRLAVLQQERARLLRENATLEASLQQPPAGVWRPTRSELADLQASLELLQARQQAVNSQTLVVEADHQTILELVTKGSAAPKNAPPRASAARARSGL